MKHFQFWHADPPEDVHAFMEDARVLAGFDYARFDRQSGRAFVAAHYGSRGVAVWDALLLPAMHADFLRLLLLDTYGGLYTDASYRFIGDLPAFIAEAPTAQMPWWNQIVNTNYMMFREPGHPFLRTCIAMLMDNVEHRRFDSVLMATGPGVINSVRCVLSPDERAGIGVVARMADWPRWGWAESLEIAERLIEPTADLVDAYRAMSLVNIDDLHKVAFAHLGASHRKRDDYWYAWKGSIYT